MTPTRRLEPSWASTSNRWIVALESIEEWFKSDVYEAPDNTSWIEATTDVLANAPFDESNRSDYVFLFPKGDLPVTAAIQGVSLREAPYPDPKDRVLLIHPDAIMERDGSHSPTTVVIRGLQLSSGSLSDHTFHRGSLNV
ncbi:MULTISPECIES: hypothetical protein [unclassified Haloferax]|jgi:hypothetical protein|uniref:hypothetical protein n=1 Tax=unclassified Haloferax TaxID=2625095 RepID=UPI0028768E94|nr:MULTISPECIES: hypothetical protein [unclassified Haloferax]MDS0243111.1 hypothetical protein [Haloferax sp. S2CR25]MDS0446232.1 hypothetical protein [Haloferax sp. S2CR25-2]